MGYGATGFKATQSTAKIHFVAGESFTDTSNASYISFLTTPTGSLTATEAARITAPGRLLIGTTTDDGISLIQNNGVLSTVGQRNALTATVTSAATLTLTVSSTFYQVFSGSTSGQIVKLPNATTLVAGHFFEIWNTSSATIAVQDDGTNSLITVQANSMVKVVLNDNSSSNGVWLTTAVGQGNSGSSAMPVYYGMKAAGKGIYMSSACSSASTSDQMTTGFPRAVMIIGYHIYSDNLGGANPLPNATVILRDNASLGVNLTSFSLSHGSAFASGWNAAGYCTLPANHSLSVFTAAGSDNVNVHLFATFWYIWHD
jgi:hypothetical protein